MTNRPLRAARRRPLTRVAGLAILALLVVVAAVAAGRPAGTAPSATTESRIFAGIPQDGITLGSPDAPFVLTEFADLQCPFCAAYARDVLPALVDRYVRTGTLRLELRVLAFLGEDSIRAGAMAAAAARQDRLWPFTDAFYRSQGAENSGYATDAFLRRIGAQTPGLDVDRALHDRGDTRMLEAAERAAGALAVSHTPAFYLRRGDGRPRPLEPSALTADAFVAALDRELTAR